MAEIRSRTQIAAGAFVTAATAGVVMSGMIDGRALVDGSLSAAAALVGFGLWIGLFSWLFASES